jgi:hypothetical protein
VLGLAAPHYHPNWFDWMKLCYDSNRDCFIGVIHEKFYAFRNVPSK